MIPSEVLTRGCSLEEFGPANVVNGFAENLFSSLCSITVTLLW